MPTATVADCTTCKQRDNQIIAARQHVLMLVRKMNRAQDRMLAPHLQRGILTQLNRAKVGLTKAQDSLSDHKFGDCQ